MPTKKQILAGRKAVDAYRTAHAALHKKPYYRGIHADHTPLLNIMLKALEGLGFNSQAEFFDANEELCYQEVQRCYQMSGACDGCKGRDFACLSRQCFLDNSELLPSGNRAYIWRWKDFYDWRNFEGHSPDGCAYKFEKVAEPGFDIYWGMPTGITPEAYERFKGQE